jgi:type I restriction enzyme S subunit
VISKLGDLATISKRTISTQGLESNSFWHYSIPAFDTEGYPELTMGREIASNKYILETNCVMVSKLNPEFERIWTVIDPLPNSISSTEFVILLPKDHSYLAFINSFVRSSDFHKYMIAFATGSTGSRQRFTPEDILSIQIGSFDIELIKTFSKFALPLLKQINISGRAQHSLGKFVQRNFTYLISNVA